MDRSQGPSNKHILFLFMGFLVLFILVFALGVIVGKGLSDSRVAVSRNAQEKTIQGINNNALDSYDNTDEVDEVQDELEDILDDVKSKEMEDSEGFDLPDSDDVDSDEHTQEKEVEEGKKIELSSDTNINLKVEKPEVLKNTVSQPKISDYSALPKIDPNGQYTVQIGSFKNESDAKKLQNKLKSGGYPAFIKQAIIGQETWFRLRVGTFTNKDQAKIYGDMLLKKESGTIQSVYVTPNL
jgi:cell division septation protein DedD